MWNFILVIVAVLLIGMVFYLETRFLNFNFIKKIDNKIIMYLITLLPFLMLLLFFDYVNFVVIIFHLFIFFIIYGIIFYVFRKLRNKKESKIYLTGVFAIITTIIYLGIGYYLNSSIVETKYVINTNKDINENIRILQISDTHIGTSLSSDKFSKYVDIMNKTKPDLVVVTGDFVDDSTKKDEMIESVKSLSKFNSKYGVYFIYGNHDKGYFEKEFDSADLINELIKNDVTILEDQTMLIEDNFYLIGRNDKRYNRLSMEELTNTLDKEKYMIVLDHEPNDYENEKESNVDLVLSGHTHGGQLFPFGYIGLLINANDAFKGLEKRDNTNFIVNTGMSGWAIKFKTGTRSEYTIIDIIKEGNNE